MALELVIKVRPENYNRAIRQIRTGARGAQKDLSSLQRTIGGLFAGVSAALILNEFRKAIVASNEFEAALVGVGKTAGLSAEELAVLGDELDRMSRLPGMPQAEQLLEIAKVAGQLGIKGVADISKFTDTMAKLGSATDLVGEEGASAIARLLVITGEAVDTVPVLGSVITALGNDFNTTEKKIAFHAAQVARATAIYDIGSTQAAVFATVLSSMGVRAELAGSAMGRAFRAIDAAVRTGGKSLENLARISRVTAEEMAEAFGRSPVEAMNLLLKGIRDLDAESGNVPAALASIGLKGEELLQVIPVLAKEFDVLAAAQARAAVETENATALEDEFAKSAATRSASMQRLGNTFDTVARIIGGAFAPAIALAADELSGGLDALIGWNEQGDDLERLLDELAPSAETAAKAFKNLALEVERSAEAQKLLQLIATYNRLLDEQVKVASRISGLSDENLAGVLGIKLQTRLEKMAVAFDLLPEQIDAARLALASVGEEEEKVAAGALAVARSVEEMDKAWANAINRLNTARDRLREISELQRGLVAPLGTDFGAIAGAFIDQDIEAQLAPPMISAIETAFEEVNYDQVFGDEVTQSLGAAFDTVGDRFQEKMSEIVNFIKDNLAGIISSLIRIGQDFGRREQGRFGGTLTGDFGTEGEQVGQLAGFIVGGPLGAVIGEVIGGVIGGAIKQGADEGLASLRQIGNDVAIRITRDEGGLGGVALQIGEAFNAALSGVEDLLRGQIDIAGFDIKIRDDVISIFINGITGTFDNIADAVNFALVESLQGATFFGAGPGASPEVLAVLQQFTSDSIEVLNEELAKAIGLQELRQGTFLVAAEAKAAELFELLRFAIEKGIDTAGVIGAFDDMRSAALGFTLTAKESRAAEIEAFNQAILTKIEILKAEEAVADARIAGTQVLVDTSLATGQALGFLGQQIGIMGQVAVASTAGFADAIARLQGLLIGADEAARAIAAAGRRGGRRGGTSGRGAARGGFRDQIEALALVTAGLPDAELAAAQFALSIRELQEQMAAARLPAEEQAELIRLLTLAEEQRIDALVVALRTLDEQLGDVFQDTAGFLARALGDQEILADLERLAFLEQLEFHRLQLAALEAAAELQGDLTDTQRERLQLLRDLFERVGENLPDILDGFSTTVEQAGRDFAAAVSVGASGFGTGTLADRAFVLLQQLSGLQGGGAGNRFQAINRNIDDMLAAFGEVAGALGLFGTNIFEVTAELEDLRAAQIGQLFEPVDAALQSIVDSIRGGPLSGLSARGQFEAQLSGIQDLIAQAASGDLETAFLARQQLQQQLPGFLNIAGSGLLAGFGPFAAGIANQLEALGLGSVGAAGTGTLLDGTGRFGGLDSPAQVQSAGTLVEIRDLQQAQQTREERHNREVEGLMRERNLLKQAELDEMRRQERTA